MSKGVRPWVILLMLFSIIYFLGELLARNYIDSIRMQRMQHSFDRTLIISGKQSARSGLPVAGNTPANKSDFTGSEDSTHFISSETINWIKGRPFTETISTWSTQYWDSTIGEEKFSQLYLYGIGEGDLATFNLGKGSDLLEGSIMLPKSFPYFHEKTEDTKEIQLSISSKVLTQVPPDIAEILRTAGTKIIPLSKERLADPPGLQPGRKVAYILRDADQFSDFNKPALIYMIVLKDAEKIDDAKFEINDYLERFEKPSPLGVRAEVMTVDEYFPPVITPQTLLTILLWVRLTLLMMFIAVGFGVSWLKLREHAFEAALRTALGSTPSQAFLRVYGYWLGQLTCGAILGALFALPLGFMTGGLSSLPFALGVLLIALLGLWFGTFLIAHPASKKEPLATLAEQAT